MANTAANKNNRSVIAQGGQSLWRISDQNEVKPTGRRVRLFEEPEELYEAIKAYFQWVDTSPIYEDVVGFTKDGVKHASRRHPRAMSILACCAFIGISFKVWRDFENTRPDLLPVLEWARTIMYAQKFEGAAAGLFNGNIIARDLGLIEKAEVNGAPLKKDTEEPEVDLSKLSDEKLEQLYSIMNEMGDPSKMIELKSCEADA